MNKNNPTNEHPPIADVPVEVADPSIHETAPTLAEVGEAVAGLRCGKAAGVYGISGEMLKE